MVSYSKGANKSSVVRKRTVLGRCRFPLPDQLWKGPGCGGAGLSEEAIIAMAYQFIWPSEFVRSAKDDSVIRLAIRRQL